MASIGGGASQAIARLKTFASGGVDFDDDYIQPFPLGLSLEANGGGSVTSGALRLTYFKATETAVVDAVKTGVSTVSAGDTCTVARIGLFSVAADGGITRIAVTANDTTAFRSTSKDIAFEATAQVVAGTTYAVGHLYVGSGGTAPSFHGIRSTASAVFGTDSRRINGSVSAQSDMPTSVVIGSIANTGNRFWFGLRKV